MTMELSLNRRQLFRAAAGTFAAAAASGAIVLSRAEAEPSSDGPNMNSPAKQPSAESPAPPAAAALDKGAPETGEGVALADAALASAGYPLPTDSEAEVRKQLSSYPGAFAAARKFQLANGNAPVTAVTPPLP